MHQVIKERLVGIFVIVSALVLILPYLLAPVATEPDYQRPVIPAKPDILNEMSDERDQRPQRNLERADISSIEDQLDSDQRAYAIVDVPVSRSEAQPGSSAVELVEQLDQQGQASQPDKPESEQPESEPMLFQDSRVVDWVGQTAQAKHQVTTLEKPLMPLNAGKRLTGESEFSLDLKPAWQVQVASFENAANAKRVADGLLNKGFRVYQRKVVLASGTVYRVFVGPEILRSRAEFYASEISKILDTETMVVRYAP